MTARGNCQPPEVPYRGLSSVSQSKAVTADALQPSPELAEAA
jgi:hypothetical protein